MAITLDGSTGITVGTGQTIVGTDLGSVVAPGNTVQTQSTSLNTYASFTTSTNVDTGLSISITPKFNTSKVLVTFSLAGLSSSINSGSNAVAIFIYLYKNGSNLVQMEDHWGYTNNSTPHFGAATYSYLDSPATTSAVTYAVYFKGQHTGQTVAINNYFSTNGGSRSAMTAREIAQ